jgi:hypothetical protein
MLHDRSLNAELESYQLALAVDHQSGSLPVIALDWQAFVTRRRPAAESASAACPLLAGRAVDGDAFGSDAKFSHSRIVAASACLQRGDGAADG